MGWVVIGFAEHSAHRFILAIISGVLINVEKGDGSEVTGININFDTVEEGGSEFYIIYGQNKEKRTKVATLRNS